MTCELCECEIVDFMFDGVCARCIHEELTLVKKNKRRADIAEGKGEASSRGLVEHDIKDAVETGAMSINTARFNLENITEG